MSPTQKAVRNLEESGLVWAWLFRISLVLVPLTATFMFTETMANRSFREQGGRVTEERYNREETHQNEHIDNIEESLGQILDIVIRTDERVAAMQREISK